jgi:hypothetical protein
MGAARKAPSVPQRTVSLDGYFQGLAPAIKAKVPLKAVDSGCLEVLEFCEARDRL